MPSKKSIKKKKKRLREKKRQKQRKIGNLSSTNSNKILLENSMPKTQAMFEERESISDNMRQSKVSSSQLNLFHQILSMVPNSKKEMFLGPSNNQLPNYHLELKSSSQFPIGLSPGVVLPKLLYNYNTNLMNPYLPQLNMSKENYKPSTKDLLKRWHGIGKFNNGWNPKCYGDIFDEEKYLNFQRDSYCKMISHSFSNDSYRKEILYGGTAHVAVGFVDLGTLLMSQINFNKGLQLHFVGVERSAYSVAKFSVVWECAKLDAYPKDVIARSMIQMWFSSTWEPKTFKLFKISVERVIKQGKHYSDQVKNILNHWSKSNGVTLLKAREGWETLHKNYFLNVAHMERKIDRIAVAFYELTGDFGVDSQNPNLAGSVMMFDFPDGTPPLQSGESVLGVVELHLESEIIFGSYINISQVSIVTIIHNFINKNILKLINWASNSKVIVDLRHSDIRDCIDEISKLHPWTMSWSNICDYVGIRAFHKMARKCSKLGDTIHYGYSMNWSTKTYGANVIDYQSCKMRKNLIEKGTELINHANKTLKLSSIFRSPPPTNPINIAFAVLAPYFSKDWLRYWFKVAKEQGECIVINTETTLYNPFKQLSGAARFTWTYDPKITFINANNGSSINEVSI